MTRFYLRIIVVIFLAIMASIIAFVRLAKVWEERFFEPKAIKQLSLAQSLDLQTLHLARLPTQHRDREALGITPTFSSVKTDMHYRRSSFG